MFKPRIIGRTEKITQEIPLEQPVTKVVNNSTSKDISELKLEFPCLITIAGKSRTGKTVLTKKLIELHRDNWDTIVIVSYTGAVNPEYRSLSKHIIKPEELGKLERIIDLQEKAIEKYGPECSKLLLLVDNFCGALTTHTGKGAKIFDKLASMGRHIGITTVLLVQSLTKISPILRSNTMFWFCTRLPRQSIEDVLHQYQDKFPNKYAFYNWYNKVTSERFSSIFINTEDSYGDSVLAIKPVKYNSKS